VFRGHLGFHEVVRIEHLQYIKAIFIWGNGITPRASVRGPRCSID